MGKTDKINQNKVIRLLKIVIMARKGKIGGRESNSLGWGYILDRALRESGQMNKK